ncbi:hypothetical protein CVIRNUC_000261 [Coccomyxa viridis]|uniref:Protein kinase domain-containing protein n=1 Tax=Coccomyxa viridis TaxID=1274662 RepID=A0AAV1HRC1_9CHLO|nr:hypothetical protein CVIRNUC_000261 [Coccomyxa viridis]
MAARDKFRQMIGRKAASDNLLAGDKRYIKIRTLGKGTYGIVLLAVDNKTRQKVAIKFWPRGSEAINVDVQRELHHHSGFNHPNVIKFHEVFLTPTHVALAMELAPNGDLFKKVSNAKGLPESEARGIFQQLILAVDYCHRMGVANRDIKLENVLLGGDKKKPIIKLTDFGFSKSVQDSIPTTICGTLGYMAPEVLLGQEYDGMKADVWSCGVMLYVMLYGQYPNEDPRATVLQDIQIPDRPATLPDVKHLIRCMLERDSQRRIKMEDICQQPWVAQGLPEDFLTQNEQFVSASAQHMPGQTKEEINAILYEAGLQKPEERKAREAALKAVQNLQHSTTSGMATDGSSGLGSGQGSTASTFNGHQLQDSHYGGMMEY